MNQSIGAAKYAVETHSWKVIDSPSGKIKGTLDTADVFLDSKGAATVFWEETNTDFTKSSLVSSTSDAGSKKWSTPTEIYKGETIMSPRLCTDKTGNAFASWLVEVNGFFKFQGALKLLDKKWTTAVEFASGGAGHTAQAISPLGTAVILYGDWGILKSLTGKDLFKANSPNSLKRKGTKNAKERKDG